MNPYPRGFRALALGAECVVALTLNLAHAQVSPTTAADVVRVVDGDTVDVRFDNGKLERLRLIGMDTPELVDPRKPVLIWPASAVGTSSYVDATLPS